MATSGLPDISLNLNTVVAVEGADVFVVVNFSTTNHPVAATTMLKLINRVREFR